MDNTRNRRIYRRWAPIYDTLFRPLSTRARQRAIAILDLHPGEHVLIPGIGTGLDLPLLPPEVRVTGVDLSPEMLARAQQKAAGRDVRLEVMDATQLTLPDASADALLFSLVLSVVPDGAAVFREAWRVLKPGGRAVIFDKFLPESAPLTRGRRLLGALIRALGTDPNRSLSSILSGAPGLTIESNLPSLLGGQYRIVRLCKAV